MTKIPFNIDYRHQIESGEYKVVTREDRPVEIKLWDLKGDFPIVGVYYDDKNNRETAVQVTAEGRCSIKPNDDYCDDFFVITDEPELTEFEQTLELILNDAEDRISPIDYDFVKKVSSELLTIAREEIEKDLPKWKRMPIPDSLGPRSSITTGFTDAIVLAPDYYIMMDELLRLPKEFKVGDVIKEKGCTTHYEILEIYKDGSLFLNDDYTIPPSEIHNWELVDNSPKSK